jgi:formate dehydrogenase subunit delta
MDVSKLVRMANQIAANFDGGSNEAAAVAGVADHIRRFWTPSMRRQIVEHWQEQRGDLSPRAAQAIAAIAD